MKNDGDRGGKSVLVSLRMGVGDGDEMERGIGGKRERERKRKRGGIRSMRTERWSHNLKATL